ncbi:Uncharacterised protein [Escherichia coli]|nr:hypothetical protein BvCmsJ77A_04699 [Escherichia coli]GDR22598.1 hypothetical protein BvCmsOUNP033_04819 [Escherichia coli]SQS20875.1 Uncharacterised protein [Escherichia coli]SQZ87410.1 Uncharacterised protein [Escherichia coli]
MRKNRFTVHQGIAVIRSGILQSDYFRFFNLRYNEAPGAA